MLPSIDGISDVTIALSTLARKSMPVALGLDRPGRRAESWV